MRCFRSDMYDPFNLIDATTIKQRVFDISNLDKRKLTQFSHFWNVFTLKNKYNPIVIVDVSTLALILQNTLAKTRKFPSNSSNDNELAN